MEQKLYNEFSNKDWGRGISSQLAIEPQKAKPENGNFVWMASISRDKKEDIEKESFSEGKSFSTFPMHNRTLVVLEGNIILSHGEDRAERLGKHAQETFDGAVRTDSFGNMEGYLLTAMKEAEANIEVHRLKEKHIKKFQTKPDKEKGNVIVYCVGGFAVVIVDGKRTPMTKGEQFVLSFAKEEKGEVTLLGNGIFVIGEILYNDKLCEEIFVKKELIIEKNEISEANEVSGGISPIKNEKLSEYLFAMKLGNLSWRGQGMLRPKEDPLVYSKQLKRRIEIIKSAFLSFFIGLLTLGLGLFIVYTADKENLYIWMLIGWGFLFVLVINPLIYYIAMPKPLYKHVRYKESLTEVEMEQFVERKSEKSRADRILKKYKISGRNKYIDDDDF